jgi:hypothetical protein
MTSVSLFDVPLHIPPIALDSGMETNSPPEHIDVWDVSLRCVGVGLESECRIQMSIVTFLGTDRGRISSAILAWNHTLSLLHSGNLDKQTFRDLHGCLSG